MEVPKQFYNIYQLVFDNSEEFESLIHRVDDILSKNVKAMIENGEQRCRYEDKDFYFAMNTSNKVMQVYVKIKKDNLDRDFNLNIFNVSRLLDKESQHVVDIAYNIEDREENLSYDLMKKGKNVYLVLKKNILSIETRQRYVDEEIVARPLTERHVSYIDSML